MAGWWLLAAWGLIWTLTTAQKCSRYGPRKSCGEVDRRSAFHSLCCLICQMRMCTGPWECKSWRCHCPTPPAAGPPDILEDNCRTQGCCWDPLETTDPHIDLADCFYANNGRSDYQLVQSALQGMLLTAVPSKWGGEGEQRIVWSALLLARSCRPCTGCRDRIWLDACPLHVMPLQLCVGSQRGTGSTSCQRHHLEVILFKSVPPQADAHGQRQLHITASVSAHAITCACRSSLAGQAAHYGYVADCTGP